MNRLTHKMKARASNVITSNIEMLFPFDEGSGDILADATGKYVFNFAGADYSVAHRTKHYWANSKRTDNNVVTPPVGKHILMFVYGTPLSNLALFNFTVGSIGSFYMGLYPATATIDSSDSTSLALSFGTIVLGDSVLLALTLNKETGILTAYNSINGANTVKIGEANAAAHLPAMKNTANNIQIGSFTCEYGIAGLLYLDSLPTNADLLSILDAVRIDAEKGHKYLDDRLANY